MYAFAPSRLYILRINYTLAAEKALYYARTPRRGTVDFVYQYTKLKLDQEPECILMGMGQLYIMMYDVTSKTLVESYVTFTTNTYRYISIYRSHDTYWMTNNITIHT